MTNSERDRARSCTPAAAAGRVAAMAAALVVALSGCGGGLAAGGGIGGSGFVAGPIDELGSITVEGVRFDIDDATVVANGEAAAAADLALGMFVGVYGDIDEDAGTGVATRVEFEESVSGPVTFVSATGRRIVVLEQTVFLRDSTRLAGIPAGGVQRGMAVTVSGSRDADGVIVATRVSSREALDVCRVVGDVEGLAADGSSFRIGDLVVDATGALVVGGALVEGDSVGIRAVDCSADGPLDAREIRRLDVTRPPLPGLLRRVRGFVVERRGASRFVLRVPTVGRVVVRLVARTEFDGGTAADISVNDALRVAGVVDGEGTLTAARVVFLDGD